MKMRGTERGTIRHNAEISLISQKPLVRSRRLELPRELPHSDLNAARLPIPPRPQYLCAIAVGFGVVKPSAGKILQRLQTFPGAPR